MLFKFIKYFMNIMNNFAETNNDLTIDNYVIII